ncbi:ABC transporter substrate-binding protein [Kutzneria sp. CA-103260]|uniref:ABC transporter substrate-binding protein n=1 Tax=Kutzneria sp. CA-103260 TaxID=2802641 RepID=UPI001BADB6BD|nr:ABC transporter substrate-binding protein [Kutzneria sp. CA-103260]QUQ65559.1 sugar transporter sugar binding lipoprotein [Kutzneria sp. CA-103260]
MGAHLSRRDVLRGLGITALAGVVAGCGGPDDGVGPDGRVTIELWHGQNDSGRKVIEALIADFQRGHPDIVVDTSGGALADGLLEKVMTALASGSHPDIAYIFGADLPSVARSPQVVDMTDEVRSWSVPWTDYWQPARDAVTVNGRVRAVPAVVDTLAVVCNKTLFDQAGLPLPKPGWSWSDFLATAKKLTDPAGGVFGTGWPGTGDEDTVWRLWPMVWDLGGQIIDADGTGIGFRQEGERALGVVRRLATDKSVYIDPKAGSEQLYQVFESGRMGMVMTGPWQLPDIIQSGVDYHVAPLPTFGGKPVTISGPDTWTLFDNGPARVRAARTFVRWLTDPAQDVRWDVAAGSLPLSKDAENRKEWHDNAAQTEGLSVFVDALTSARVRPAHPAYPQVSQAVGTAIVSMLLNRSTPAQAMRACADEADAALIIPR